MSSDMETDLTEKLYVRGGSKPLYSHVTAIEGGRKLIFNFSFALTWRICARISFSADDIAASFSSRAT